MTGLQAAGRRQTLAFHLRGQPLAQRLPADRLLEAAGACGMTNTPPGAGPVCFAPRRGNEVSFKRTEPCLGASIADDPGAGAGLVHPYLGCYGPSRREHFAA